MWVGLNLNLVLWLMMMRGRKVSDDSYFRMFVMMIKMMLDELMKKRLMSRVSVTVADWLYICVYAQKHTSVMFECTYTYVFL